MRSTHHRTRAMRLGLALFVFTAAQAAHADPLGGDIPILTGILVQATDQVTRMTETLATLRRTYEDARRVAGYADDAYQAFNQFQSFNAQLFRQDLARSLETSFPDIAYFRRQASDTGPWAKGTGELQRLITICLLGTGAGCTQIQEAISLKQAREALVTTFGAAPEGAYDLKAIDHEAAVALSSSSAQQGRSASAREVSRKLLSQCGVDAFGNVVANSKDPRVLAQCQAAAASAQIVALQQTADLADQVAETNRLQAMQLAQKNQDRKRELSEAQERREFLLEAATQAARRPIPMETDGFNLLEEGR